MALYELSTDNIVALDLIDFVLQGLLASFCHANHKRLVAQRLGCGRTPCKIAF